MVQKPTTDLKILLLASRNPHKIGELQQLLEPLGIELKSTRDLLLDDEVEEDRPTLEENALKKARFWHAKTGLTALADDTGLEVEALDGRPGIYSARYAGEYASYRDNVEKLLGELENKTNRKAQFRTVIALAGDQEQLFEGVCEGRITREPRGGGGFGYDPVFIAKGYKKTFAELTAREKNHISHRGRALRKLIESLKSENR